MKCGRRWSAGPRASGTGSSLSNNSSAIYSGSRSRTITGLSLKVSLTNSRIPNCISTIFIKVDEPGVVNVKYVPQLMLRGAAFLCTKLVQGVDVVIPASRDGNKMILVQVENDGAYGAYVDPRVFEEMDPAKLRIGELTAVIRIVFALASNEAKLHIESHVLKYKSGKRCRAYDIWCAGLSPEILGAVTVGNQAVWEALCEAGGRWRKSL